MKVYHDKAEALVQQALESNAVVSVVAFLKRNIWYFYFGGFSLAEIALLLFKASQ